MDPYRNTVHLEDKRDEFENCYKLKRQEKSSRNTVQKARNTNVAVYRKIVKVDFNKISI